MQAKVLLENMSGKLNYIGKPIKSIGYYSYKTNKKSQSIAIYTSNFVGRIILEGSLKEYPTNDSDWFVIPLKDDLPYIEYNDYDYRSETVSHNNSIYTLNANYVWLRAKLDRSYLINESNIKPVELESSYIITANTDLNQQSSTMIYTKSFLNPKDDPEYYEGWTPNFSSANDKRMAKAKFGNVEKMLLCF